MLWFVLFLIVIVGNILRITITNFYKSSSAEYAELMKEKKELEREIIEEHLFIGSLIAITSIIIIVLQYGLILSQIIKSFQKKGVVKPLFLCYNGITPREKGKNMLEFIYSIIGCAFIIAGTFSLLTFAICKIMLYRKVRIIRLDMASCYSQGYKDGKKNKEYNPPQHITIEQ